MNWNEYGAFIIEETKKLLAIDSPSGMTKKAAEHVAARFEALGYAPQTTRKDGVLVCLGDRDRENGLLLEAHMDTLGGMVCQIKANGRLKITPIGGLRAENVETENCRVVTKFDGVIEGTAQLINASTHVNEKYADTQRTFDTVEIVLDEPVADAEDVKKLGIRTGDYVCFEPRTRVTQSGYIKSRFLDDKLSAAILLGYAKYIRENNITPLRKVYQHMTVFEEVGHGACASIPEDVTELLSVDMGCVGDGLECTERQVSICAKDGHGPYNYQVTTGLVNAAKKDSIDYAVDIYPFYGSDADAALSAGKDARHGLIGAGVYASHGYERSHKDGVVNTFRLLCSYLNGNAPKMD